MPTSNRSRSIRTRPHASSMGWRPLTGHRSAPARTPRTAQSDSESRPAGSVVVGRRDAQTYAGARFPPVDLPAELHRQKHTLLKVKHRSIIVQTFSPDLRMVHDHLT